MISGDLYNSGMNFKFMFSGGMFWHVLKVHALIFFATPSSGINKQFFRFHSIINELDLFNLLFKVSPMLSFRLVTATYSTIMRHYDEGFRLFFLKHHRP